MVRIGRLRSTLKPPAAKDPSVDPSTLSGFTCANPIVIDESFDANYKLFKNQNGEVIARYIGTNYRNGSP